MTTKIKSIAALSILALTAFLYSACTKETKVNTPVNNDKAIATSIAVNLYKSIGNTIASQNDKTGLPAASGVRNGIKVNDLTCGELIEVPYNNIYTKGDSVKDVMIGSNKYVVSCNGNQPNGYTYSGTYKNTGFSPYAVYDNSVDEYYTLKALLPGFAKMQVDGNQVSVYKVTTKKDGEYMEQHNSYVLSGLIIDASNRPFDITAGTASFTSNGNNAGRAFSFTGTIQFLGSHKAKVSFDGKTFDITIE
ncbi:hypothetical protein ACFQZI_10720 [Mucilaginibacter lutimaris]|uniref:Lipoprotein n=1 Tax=Mucilaginibacter lutimaris TaxID=931629 RepID=A0ABW2ZGH4_9SPHI